MTIDPLDTLRILGLSERAIQERLETISLGDQERALLRSIWPIIESHQGDFVKKLYARFVEIPELKQILHSESRVARLMELQRKYLQELFCSSIDRDYVIGRLRIGLVHHRIRLEPQWYLASYAHFLCDFVDPIIESSTDETDGMAKLIALFKTIIFDASLVLDSYGLSVDAQRLERIFHPSSGNESDEGAQARESVSRVSSEEVRKSERSRLRHTPLETVSRSSFIGIGSEDSIFLRSLRESFSKSSDGVLEDFYQYLTHNPKFHDLIRHNQIQRLIQQVRSYWQELLAGSFDQEYASSRKRIGVVHEGIGIEPQLYLAGLCRQVVGFLKDIPIDLPNRNDAIRAFFRALVFDITFIIDAYMESRAISLMRTESYASRLMQGVTSAIVIVDHLQRIVFANPNFVDLVGIAPALLSRMVLQDALPLNALQELLDEAKLGMGARTTSKGKWGSRLYRITASPLDDPDPHRKRSMAIVLDDISDMMQTANDMQGDDLSHRNLADSLPAVFWEMDLRSKTLNVISKAAIDLTGFRDSWFLGRPAAWFQCIESEDRDRFLNAISKLSVGEKNTCDYRILRADGEQIWVRSIVQCAQKNFPETIISAVSFDVSKDRETEKKRMSALFQVSGGIAHVVNNALTVIMGSIETLSDPAIDGETQDLLRHSMTACERITATIRQLQAFAGQQVFEAKECAPHTILVQWSKKLEGVIGSEVRMVSHIQQDLWLCKVDPVLLETALDHMVSNALQAMPFGGSLTVSAKNLQQDSTTFDDPGFNRDWVEIQVKDDGHGMSDDVRKRAIEPFFTTRNRAEFNGLGLSFVYGFVTQSGGHLLIESGEGQGTAVTLRFPTIRKVENTKQVLDGSSLPTVLLVDDDELVLMSIKGALQRHGYTVLCASNSADALSWGGRTQVDILVSDILLREATDGVDLAHKFSEICPKIGVILISGHADICNSGEKVLSDDWRFLAKPFKVGELVATIQSQMDLKRTSRS